MPKPKTSFVKNAYFSAMKSVFCLLMFLAVSAISLDIVTKFVDSVETVSMATEAGDSDSDTDSEDPLKDPSDNEDDEQLREKELFWEEFRFLAFRLDRPDSVQLSSRIDFFIEHPLQSPPFSPPDLV